MPEESRTGWTAEQSRQDKMNMLLGLLEERKRPTWYEVWYWRDRCREAEKRGTRGVSIERAALACSTVSSTGSDSTGGEK